MTKKIGKVGEISWVLGNVLCAIGNCLVSKSAFGLSAIIAPAFIMKKSTGLLSIGVWEYIIQGILLALCCFIIGKFKGKFIATICNILFYGACFDVVNDRIFVFLEPATMGIPQRVLVAAVGTLITGFAIALMLRTYIPPSAYEIFVREIAEAKGIDMSKMKLIFDASMLIITVIMMLALLGGFDVEILGALTVIAAFLNSVLIGFFGKLLDKYFEFTPAIPALCRLLDSNSKK